MSHYIKLKHFTLFSITNKIKTSSLKISYRFRHKTLEDIPVYCLLNMLPPIPSKQILYFRSISTMVFDKIAAETMDTSILTVSQMQLFTMPNAEDTLFMVICVYSVYVYYKTTLDESKERDRIYDNNKRKPRRPILAKRDKREQLNKYVLTEPGYHIIKICLFVLFLLIKDPKAVV